MVGPRAVVPHPPSELGEEEHDDVVVGVVLPEVVEEVGDGGRDVGPELGVGGRLSSVGVEASVLGVEDPGAHVAHVDPDHVAQTLGDGAGGILHVRRVLGQDLFEDVGALEGVQPSLAQVLHHRPGPDGGPVHVGESLQHPLALLLLLDAGQEPVGLEVGDRCHRDARRDKGPRQPLADVDGGDGVLSFGVDLPDGAAEPPFCPHLLRLAGVPDVHRAEVGPGGVGVAHAVDDGHVALVELFFQRGHGRVEAYLVVQLKHPVLGDLKGRPVVEVVPVGVGDYGVEVVVPAGELQHDQYRGFAVAVCCHLVLSLDESLLPAGAIRTGTLESQLSGRACLRLGAPTWRGRPPSPRTRVPRSRHG